MGMVPVRLVFCGLHGRNHGRGKQILWAMATMKVAKENGVVLGRAGFTYSHTSHVTRAPRP